MRACRGLFTGLALTALMPLSAMATTASAADHEPSGPVHALIRFPTLHGKRIVFEAAGSLWTTTTAGGVAQRLTADSGFDAHPAFSPNGKLIAFTGWYQGNTDVYVMPADGGPVRRLTYRSINRKQGDRLLPVDDNQVLGWTPDGKDVVFLSRRASFNPQVFQAWEVPVDGGLPTRLPMPWSGPLSFNADGTEVVYNKLYRNYSFHRKRYYGGKAQNLYTYDLATGASRQLTHWKGADTFPMRRGDTVYFASDRGPARVLNLWSLDLHTHALHQLTHFKTYDIDWPGLGDDGIVLSDGGRLFIYTLPTGPLREIPVTLPLDGGRTQPYRTRVDHAITSADLSPNGKLAVFSARGALFTVPAEHGRTDDLTHTTAADQRDPAWSPNGRWIAYLDDTGTTSRVMLRSADGSGTPRVLADDVVTHAGPLVWSPDGHWLSYTDADQRLWLVDVDSGERLQVAQDQQAITGAFGDVNWSPDSRWLAFSDDLSNHLKGLFIYDLKQRRLHQISRGEFSDFGPVFSADGKYLVFASARLVNPALSGFGFTTASLVPDGLYIATLQQKTPSPLAPRSEKPGNAVHTHRKGEHPGNKKTDQESGRPPAVKIDFNGLMSRAIQVPVPAANIAQIAMHGGVIDYLATPVQTIGAPLPGQQPELRAYSLEKRKALTLVSGVGGNGFAIAADGSTLLFRKGDHWMLRPNTFKSGVDAKPLKLDRMALRVDPRAEWNQIFDEAWRDVRDYFVNPQLIARRWSKLGDRYRRLLPQATSRRDVNWIIGNMIGSLGESHMYVYGGAHPHRSDFNPTAGLGATFALDPKSGRYYLKRIYRGDNSLPGYTAPLAQPGLHVKAGDYVLAIDGQPLKAPTNPYALLEERLGQSITLRIAAQPDVAAHTIAVRPIANSGKLHLLAWIRRNRAEVDRLSHGQVGYIYLQDMEATGMHEFVRRFYSQLEKPGLIVDDRWNLGGYIDTLLFNRLNQKMVAAWVNRHGAFQQSPEDAYIGHLAALINHGSASDGDIFAYRFQKYGLGPTVGTRTWGGVRGYEAPFTLLDGGHLVVSELAMYDPRSRWTVENIGVKPSVPQSLDTAALRQGHDTQIQRAVHVVMQEIHAHPVALPSPPAWLPAFPRQPADPPCPSDRRCTTATDSAEH